MGQIYTADDLLLSAITTPDASTITRPFKVTTATALLQTGAAAYLIGDIILLAPIPGGATVFNYEVNIPALETGSTALTWDLGDNLILSGATNIAVSTTAQTTPALGTSFTLTAAASTASFTATNGVLMINGNLFGYGALSGSTFTTVYSMTPGYTIPAGALIQQAGNFAAYQAITAMVSSAKTVMTPGFDIEGTTVVSATAVGSAIPSTPYPVPYNTVPNPNPPVPTQMGQTWLALKVHASAGTFTSTSAITGWVQYTMRGVAY